MNVIFLDFDGPMLPLRAHMLPENQGRRAEHFDPVAASAVVSMARAAPARIVISSAWQVAGRSGIERVLSLNGINPGLMHSDWATVKDSPIEGCDDMTRAQEIKAWLRRHPETARWVALDDEDVRLPNVVRCTYDDGLTVANLERACELLGVKFGDALVGLPLLGKPAPLIVSGNLRS